MTGLIPAIEGLRSSGVVGVILIRYDDSSGAIQVCVRRQHPLLEGGRRHHYLEHRPGRQPVGDSVIEQRAVGVFAQTLPVLGRDAPDEKIVVVGREADQRQNLARLRVHHDGYPAW